jgi:transcriptional regulator with XRE-family HTH domain
VSRGNAHPLVTRLRHIRMENGRTHQLVADRIGFARNTLISWEMGYRRPGLEEVEALAAELGYQITLTPITKAVT